MKTCYCCSDKTFENCCQPYISGLAKPLTAQSLMRSRFSAYATANVEYILRTTHPSTRKLYNFDSIKEWAESCLWQKLEIISTVNGLQNDKQGKVEFKAFYLDSTNQPQVHHEVSDFQKELGKWFFVAGNIVENLEK